MGAKPETTKKKVAPLHIAFDEGNGRSIDIILRYMAKIDADCSGTFKDIIPQLIEYAEFDNYLAELPFQTLEMKHKQTLKVEKQLNSQLVGIERSNRVYVDNAYYKQTFKEDTENPNF